jgi:hypothetical protein
MVIVSRVISMNTENLKKQADVELLLPLFIIKLTNADNRKGNCNFTQYGKIDTKYLKETDI